MSAPRSRCSFSWFFSIVSRISSSLMRAGVGGGSARILEPRELLVAELLMRVRRGRVVAVAIDDQHQTLPRARGHPSSSRACRRGPRARPPRDAPRPSPAARAQALLMRGSKPASRDGARDFAHLLGAAAAVNAASARSCSAPSVASPSAGNRLLQRLEHRVLDAVAPRRQQRFGEQRLHALDDRRCGTSSRRTRCRSRSENTLAPVKPSWRRDRQELRRVRSAEQHRRRDALRMRSAT